MFHERCDPNSHALWQTLNTCPGRGCLCLFKQKDFNVILISFRHRLTVELARGKSFSVRRLCSLGASV